MPHPNFEPPAPDALTQLLPAFDFKALIAAHEVGAVYLANQRSLDRDVAIKLLSPDVSADAAFRSSFEETARTMAKLNHPNLIRVFDSGFVDGMLYFVMEFVPGKSLAHSATGHHVEFQQAIGLLQGICDGLEDAHKHGIYHGSLDLACILLNKKAQPKIGNFGFSHPREENEAPSPFIAPEVASGKSAATPGGDVYSAAVILYQLLTDSTYTGDSPPASSLSSCPKHLDEVIRRAANPDPASRYPDIAEFRKALDGQKRGVRPSGAPNSEKIGVGLNKPALKVASAPAGKKPPTSKVGSAPPPPKVKVGHNWKLLRNLVIIAGLLVAIYFAWGNYQTKTVENAKKAQELKEEYELKRQQAIDDARKKIEERQAKANGERTGSTPGPVTPVPSPDESPTQSLSRLRSALAAGDRSELPRGSKTMAKNEFFLVAQPMTWQEAASFAEQHGAHLAVPNADATITWLSQAFEIDTEVWLGAGIAGRNSWTLADGKSWKPRKKPSGTGSYLSMNKHGILRAAKAGESHPFLIQWHRDGSNPGKFESLLTKTRDTLPSGPVVFPPGTRPIGSNYYLVVQRPATWMEANQLATKSGGHLAVASNTAEAQHLATLTEDLSVNHGLWLGATRTADTWKWVTGETWTATRWKDANNPTGTERAALLLNPSSGWAPEDPAQTASGFIIEWSRDQENAPKSTSSATPDSNPEIDALQAKAKRLLTRLDATRTEQLKENTKTLVWDLGIFLRSLNETDKAHWTPHVDGLKQLITNHRVPASLSPDNGIELSESMGKAMSRCARKQEEIDQEFLTGADKIRSAFSSRVQQAQLKAQSSGHSALANSLSETLAEAGTTDGWLSAMGIEAKPEDPIAETQPGENTNAIDTTGIFPLPE